MRPVAPLLDEYRSSAVLYEAVGIAGLVAEILVRDDESVVRSVVPFLILAVITFGLLAVTGVRWLTKAAPEAPGLPGTTTVEGAPQVLRRSAIEVLLVAILMFAGVASGSGIGAVIAGLAFGAGLAGFVGMLWIQRHEAGRGVRVFRETPTRLISNGRRPLFVRPR